MNSNLISIISLILDAGIFLFLLRFLAQLLQVNFYNPLIQVIVKYTAFGIKPLSSLLPTVYRCNFAALALALLFEVVKVSLHALIVVGHWLPSIMGILCWAVGDLADNTLQILTISIFASVILSWLRPTGALAFTELVYQFTTPLMRPVQKILPPVGGLDFTPIPVLLGLKFFSMLLVGPFVMLGMRLCGL